MYAKNYLVYIAYLEIVFINKALDFVDQPNQEYEGQQIGTSRMGVIVVIVVWIQELKLPQLFNATEIWHHFIFKFV